MKSQFKLVEPSMDLEEAFLKLAADYRAAGECRYTDLYDVHGMAFDNYIKNLQRECLDRALPEGPAPCSTYWMLAADKTICGISRLRKFLTPVTELDGGQVVIDVPPSLRRRGYGSMLLKLTLARAAELKMTSIIVTCDWDNFGAIGVIKNNGGMLEGSAISEGTGKKVMRFKIVLDKSLP